MTGRISLAVLFMLAFLLIPLSNTLCLKGGKAMEIKSTVFSEGGMIPQKYTCDGMDISPPLEWASIPDGTKSLAIICDDPDAPMGTWVHWVYYNIPPSMSGMPEHVETVESPPTGGTQGINDFRKFGYGGPCPPGGTHRYFFRLYALDTELSLPPGATKDKVMRAMKGHILAETYLMGKYRR